MIATRNIVLLISSTISLLCSFPALSEEKISLPDVSYVDYTLHISALTVERLQRLELGDVDSVKNSMVDALKLNIVEMYTMLREAEITGEEKRRLTTQLVLLSVMQEKYKIETWSKDKEALGILLTIKSENEKEYDKLSCFDWSQPMWVGEVSPCQ